MSRIFFTREEARKVVGNQIVALADFPSVPKGSRGTVVKAHQRCGNDWLVCVEWSLPRDVTHTETMIGDIGFNFIRKSSPITDQFCKSEYETLISEVR
jgi:hypothetical protein